MISYFQSQFTICVKFPLFLSLPRLHIVWKNYYTPYFPPYFSKLGGRWIINSIKKAQGPIVMAFKQPFSPQRWVKFVTLDEVNRNQALWQSEPKELSSSLRTRREELRLTLGPVRGRSSRWMVRRAQWAALQHWTHDWWSEVCHTLTPYWGGDWLGSVPTTTTMYNTYVFTCLCFTTYAVIHGNKKTLTTLFCNGESLVLILYMKSKGQKHNLMITFFVLVLFSPTN